MTSKPYYSLSPHGTFCADSPVLLFGGAQVGEQVAARVSGLAQHVVAADGGADQALGLGLEPERVWGDFDSLSDNARRRLGPERLHHIPEQQSTDFEKALCHISAPLVIGLGFTGERRDHELAACHALATHPKQRVILVSEQDVVCLAPPEIRFESKPGERVSLFPMGCVTGCSTGLKWPIDGLEFSPIHRIGTSNHAISYSVSLTFDRPAMLMIMPSMALPRLIAGLNNAQHWSSVFF